MSRLAVPLAGALAGSPAVCTLAAGPAACAPPAAGSPARAARRAAPAVPRPPPPARACPAEGEVDRIEGRYAVVVTPGGAAVDCPATGLHEGDVLRHGRVDAGATARLAADVARLRARLAAGDDGADLKL